MGALLDCKTVRIFAYSSIRAEVKQMVWNKAENRERDWGETLKIREKNMENGQSVFFSQGVRGSRA